MAENLKAHSPDDAIRTQQEVADILGVSRARVFALEQKALDKIVMRLRADPQLRQAFRDVTGREPE